MSGPSGRELDPNVDRADLGQRRVHDASGDERSRRLAVRALRSCEVDHHQDRRHAALRELSNADRAYRAAFQELTSVGGLEPSSYDQLLASLERLHEAARRLASS